MQPVFSYGLMQAVEVARLERTILHPMKTPPSTKGRPPNHGPLQDQQSRFHLSLLVQRIVSVARRPKWTDHDGSTKDEVFQMSSRIIRLLSIALGLHLQLERIKSKAIYTDYLSLLRPYFGSLMVSKRCVVVVWSKGQECWLRLLLSDIAALP